MRRDERPWDADGILPRTITTSGGQNYHYSGTRDFTYREYASLQGFPVWHRFVAPGIKKQIGNAFPPCVVKVLYDWIRKWLEDVDGVEPTPPLEPHDLVDLTIEDDDDDLNSRDVSNSRLNLSHLKSEVKEQKYLTKNELQQLDEEEVIALAVSASLQKPHQQNNEINPKSNVYSGNSRTNQQLQSPGRSTNNTDEWETARRESLQYHFQGQMDEQQALELARRQSVLFISKRSRQHSIIDLATDEEPMNAMYEQDNVPMCVDGGQSERYVLVGHHSVVVENDGDNDLAGSCIIAAGEDMSDTDSATIDGDHNMDLDH
ncbi:putative rip defective protein [Phaeoacremonium minimum UCRPA7]|uniref:Putative rip defective protein n=1 Tax=Phaeoacremonium minimum (strain UCR-PA7) TaxID=1286976 RepID=R8BI64_PHAM7|nr:putative rip defective protein [Phaeoacremonium minimum UCRPA7]EON99001.1 putative rip defective protein [Phaeoacremonium minimum UCRPA7]